jgi:hypothetical protein
MRYTLRPVRFSSFKYVMQSQAPGEATVARDARRNKLKLFETRIAKHSLVLHKGMTCNEFPTSAGALVEQP